MARNAVLALSVLAPLSVSALAADSLSEAEDSPQFFPIGLALVDDFYPRDPADPPSKITVLDEFPAIARAGFNLIRAGRFDFDGTPPAVWGNTDANARAYLDAARKSGLKVMMGVRCADWPPGKTLPPADLKRLLDRVRALKDHPALFGWVIGDDTPQGGYQASGPIEPDPGKLRSIRRAIKEVDASHPLMIATPSAVDDNYEYRDIADIYMLDILPIGFEVIPPGFPPEWEAHPEKVGEVADTVLKVIGPKQKIMTHVQTYNMANDSISMGGPPGDPNRLPDNLGRYPTRAEMRFMAYNGLIHGSYGVDFNCYRWNYNAYGRSDGEGGDDTSPRGNKSQWQAMASVAAELKSMAPIFLAPDANKQITVKPETAGMEFLLKGYKDKLYLIAANPSVKRKKVTFTFPKPLTAVSAYNETRPIITQTNSFADDFDGYGVHVYEVQLK